MMCLHKYRAHYVHEKWMLTIKIVAIHFLFSNIEKYINIFIFKSSYFINYLFALPKYYLIYIIKNKGYFKTWILIFYNKSSTV